MSREKILEEFTNVTIWKNGNQRAPHKPLLILYALGALTQKKQRLFFNEIEEPLRQLLRDFGPARKHFHPEYPFWRLKNDGIWQVFDGENCVLRKGHTDAKVTELRNYNVSGSFRDDIIDFLNSDALLISEVAQVVLEANFTETLYQDIIERCGIELKFNKATKKRSPEFRDNVLRAYQFQCAVCKCQIQMGGQHLVLEAAHIKWHSAGGFDSVNNGIAMCILHHKLFDRGAFSLRNGQVVVSENVYGNHTFDVQLNEFHGKQIERPIAEKYMPSPQNIDWHYQEVFRGPARE